MYVRESVGVSRMLPSNTVSVHVYECDADKYTHSVVDLSITPVKWERNEDKIKTGYIYIMIHGGILPEHGHHLIKRVEVNDSGKIIECGGIVLGRGEKISIRNLSGIDLKIELKGNSDNNPAVLKAGVIGVLTSTGKTSTEERQLIRLDTPMAAYAVGSFYAVNRHSGRKLDLRLYVLDSMSIQKAIGPDFEISLVHHGVMDSIEFLEYEDKTLLPDERIEVVSHTDSDHYELYFNGIIYGAM